METRTTYADVILPLATQPLTFAVPEVLCDRVAAGSRVVVPLGSRKFYTGIVARLHGDRPVVKHMKVIAEAVDAAPVVMPEQLRLWMWMADYYLCTPGAVMRAALPARLKLEGLSSAEAVAGDYRAPRVACLRLAPHITSRETLNEALNTLKQAPKQYAAVMEYLQLAGMEGFDAGRPAVPRRRFAAPDAVLGALEKRGIFENFRAEMRLPASGAANAALPQLTPPQKQALAEIRKGFETRDVALLHGVTGSGKTEIYIHLIAGQLAAGRNVLYMLPEIALTAQLIERIRSYFGDAVTACHSRLSDGRRAQIYRELLNPSGGRIILGVRSSVLLPTPGLGLVIVDEEHENSFKQSDNAPRYHARDAAIVLASLYGAKTLLGSATPSLESFRNASAGKYVPVTLKERFTGVALPRIIVSDTLRAAKRGEKRYHFNGVLLEHIGRTLEEKRQVILFQNRRGFSPYVECGTCGWTAGCPSCNVTLTYHKGPGVLRCHYCGYQTPVPARCPSCSAADILPRGFGTEKIEEELHTLFPGAAIDRLDADTSRSPKNYGRIIRSFEQGKTDILVGTQMITKGFDFGHVALVGILNADNLLNYPDFRAGERAFQLMTQVGGRAGRRDEQGTVVIQTSQPDHPVIGQTARGDYEAMAAAQLAERRAFLYPPYSRLVALTFRHRDKALLQRAAEAFATAGHAVFGRRLLGPEAPPVDRIRGEYLLRFLLKVEKERSAIRAKTLLLNQIEQLHTRPEFRYVDIIADVDPQ